MAPGMGRSTPLLDLLARVPGMKPTLRGAAALVRPLGKRKRFPVRPAPAPPRPGWGTRLHPGRRQGKGGLWRGEGRVEDRRPSFRQGLQESTHPEHPGPAAAAAAGPPNPELSFSRSSTPPLPLAPGRRRVPRLAPPFRGGG